MLLIQSPTAINKTMLFALVLLRSLRLHEYTKHFEEISEAHNSSIFKFNSKTKEFKELLMAS